VPTERARTRLIHDGFDPDIIYVTGIPVERRFAQHPDRSSAAQRLHLDPDHPLVLIMGGGLGVGAMDAVARSVLARPLDAQIAFITGRNHVLRRQLKVLSRSWIVHGFVRNMPDWLAVATVAISKAGGLAASELLAAGVPTIVPRALTGHEALNAEYFAATGAACLAASASEAVTQADRLLHDPFERERMRRQAGLAARPAAAAHIVDLALNAARVATRYPVLIPDHVPPTPLPTF
jgi:processive 1,2-diacylglycerol beta-glucosyltransferase